ncbi:phosphopantetheine-binding protein [uncultured Microbacterium sp.]|uniref:phosphopantetheine-binding protein n=1 Tax=uncultured Microbacterium sp. TaxID=191216 RepID=UPI0025E183C6|nr:phosphopantetheine-binding protein [uncultured Microbacterium sp.]
MTEQSIEQEIAAAIVERLGLEIEPADVDADAPIFASLVEGTEHEQSSLNLDSIDILEVVLALNAAFDVELPDDQPEVFTSVRTIADYVRAHRADAA